MLKFLKSIFVMRGDTYNSRLEQYLKSKGCSDTSCVEYWIKEFERKN
jgi:hypothetical protein